MDCEHFSAINQLMGKFGFEPSDEAGTDQASDGYATASVHLGKHQEAVRFSLKSWSVTDYVQHWREAAAALLDGQSPVLFCTDYATISCSCFVGWPDNGNFVFEEWVIARENLGREGLRLSYVGANDEPNPNASRFHVSADDVKAYV